MREMGGLGLDGGDGSIKGAGDAGKGKPKTKEEIEQEKAFKAAWEAMLVEGMDGMVGEGMKPGELPAFNPTASGSGGEKEKEKEKDFAAGIRATMDKLKSSESALKVNFFSMLRILIQPSKNSNYNPGLHSDIIRRPIRSAPLPIERCGSGGPHV